jgi:hypothetical protein
MKELRVLQQIGPWDGSPSHPNKKGRGPDQDSHREILPRIGSNLQKGLSVN